MRERDHVKCVWFVVDESEYDEDSRETSEQVFTADTLRECKEWALENYGLKAKKILGAARFNADFDSCEICDDADKTCVQHVG